MTKDVSVSTFAQWRKVARMLIAKKIPPHEVLWHPPHQLPLFAETTCELKDSYFRVPSTFMRMAESASCHREEKKWDLLYRILWKLCYEEKNMIHVSTDRDIFELRRMQKEVARDCHKMKAFVRFRKTIASSQHYMMGKINWSGDVWIAWHQPSHFIVERTSPFFARRFSCMHWAILTPDISAYWDQTNLFYGEGVARHHAPQHDSYEELWLTFYQHIFNPARIKVAMMKSEMPMKYWHTLPETSVIKEMLHQSSTTSSLESSLYNIKKGEIQ